MFNPHFVRIAQSRTNTSPDIVDDACAFAWQQFMRYQPDRERNWRAWMVTTAEREAWRLHGVKADHVGFVITDDEGRQGPIHEPADPHDQPAIRMRLREALQALARVPDRRRQVKALHVTGFSYDEIGERLDLSYNTREPLDDRGQHGDPRGAGQDGGCRSVPVGRLQHAAGELAHQPARPVISSGRRPPAGSWSASSGKSRKAIGTSSTELSFPAERDHPYP